MKNVLGIALALAVGFLLWQQELTRREVQSLRATLATVHLLAETNKPVTRPDNTQELAELQRELAKLQMERIQEARASSQHKPVPPPPAEQQVASEAQRSFSPVIDNTLALGVLDGRAWEEMEADVAKMSKDENRAFWIQVFDGIERGELQVVPPDGNAQ